MPPVISVIVPVYNAAPWLRRCVDSILAQTYRDLEVILVDDGSPDCSGAICDEYAGKDQRVRVVHKPNGGPASARNRGLDLAAGAYLAFVDGDDYIEPDMMEQQYALARKYQADVVCCAISQHREGENFLPPPSRQIQVCGWDTVAGRLLQGELIFTSLCNKLYRQELREQLRGDEKIAFTEDLLANYYALRSAGVIVLDNTPRYHYVVRGNSLVQASLSEKQFTALTVSDRLMALEADDPDCLACCRRHRDIILMTLITRIIKADVFWERYPDLRAEVLKDYKAIMGSGLYNRKEKLTAFLLKYCPWAYRAAVRAKVSRHSEKTERAEGEAAF